MSTNLTASIRIHGHSFGLNSWLPRCISTNVGGDPSVRTLLEIADLDQISLLGLIENGHVIDLTAEGFAEEYNLEGSAKVIDRIRNCFAARTEGE